LAVGCRIRELKTPKDQQARSDFKRLNLKL